MNCVLAITSQAPIGGTIRGVESDGQLEVTVDNSVQVVKQAERAKRTLRN
jgi:hypothetical protein